MGATQITLSDETSRKIEDLKNSLGISNRSRIIAQSVSVFHSLKENIEAGDKIVIERENGDREVLSLIIC